MENVFKHFLLIGFSLTTLVGCKQCKTGEPEIFEEIFPPCDVCVAVKVVNKKTNVVTLFDSQTVQTLRNKNDSLMIRQNGVIAVQLANFKQRLDIANRELRVYYFQSITSSTTKTIRFTLTSSADTPLVTSVIMDGEYNAAIDTVDIYYRR